MINHRLPSGYDIDEPRSDAASCRPDCAGERGWALLGLILALGIISIMIVSTVTPNFQTRVQRDKEAEMIYRGEQMAEAIARYYGRGRLQALNFQAPPPQYGYLLELEKLSEGVIDGAIEKRFVRSSAMIDPLVNGEWEPVRLRDPRIAAALNVYSTQPNVFIPQSYWLIAGPPAATISVPSTATITNTQEGTGATSSEGGGVTTGGAAGGTSNGTGTSVTPTGPPGATPQTVPPTTSGQSGSSQSGSNNPTEPQDPLSRFFHDGFENRNLPIVGVATRKKGASIRAYKGLRSYEEWIFIYLPTQREVERSIREQQQQPRQPANQNRGQRGNTRQGSRSRNP